MFYHRKQEAVGGCSSASIQDLPSFMQRLRAFHTGFSCLNLLTSTNRVGVHVWRPSGWRSNSSVCTWALETDWYIWILRLSRCESFFILLQEAQQELIKIKTPSEATHATFYPLLTPPKPPGRPPSHTRPLVLFKHPVWQKSAKTSSLFFNLRHTELRFSPVQLLQVQSRTDLFSPVKSGQTRFTLVRSGGVRTGSVWLVPSPRLLALSLRLLTLM